MEILDVVMPETMPLERLEAEITELAGHLAAAECRWMLLIAEFDRRSGYEQWGCRTCPHWLNWHCGLDMRAARERVRAARALEGLPVITEAFAAGVLSYSKVRALTRVATPANEASLVMIAQHATAAQVERTVRTYRSVLSQDDELDETNRRHAARYLRCDWADDGMLEGRFKMPPEVGAVFLKAIALMREQIPVEPIDENGSAEPPDDHAATNIDALAMLAASFLEHGGATRNGGDRYQIVINTEAEVLAGDADGVCELANGPALCPETVRRLACDASIVIVNSDGERTVLQVGDKTPAIPAATRRAIRRRDGGCRFPGCSARAFTNIHHLHHRAKGGSNEHHNLLELCWHHHRLVHEGGWNDRVDDRGEVLAIRPNGNVLREKRPLPLADARNIEHDNESYGITIDRNTCIPRCYGDKLDLDHIITGLLCLDHPERVLGPMN
ncbi:MAG: hypothetical protein QOI44_58 [Actinomycetota bacterium]|nr:hypothetical protein [Actinomycetota bacterium]